MKRLPSRFRRLDDALASLPPDEPMLLSELDGFLTGILVCPDLVLPGEWLPLVWGSDEAGGAPFEDPVDVQWFADTVTARYDEIARDVGRGRPKPIFDVDERNGEVLWEAWVDGFDQSLCLRADAWKALADGDDRDGAEALLSMATLISVAHDETGLDAMELDAIHDRAPTDIPALVLRLQASRLRGATGGNGTAAAPPPTTTPKPGRNDPCRCGSGRKYKRCCG